MNRTIEQLTPIKSKDVAPKYNADEIADKLAAAVKYLRDSKQRDPKQILELELMYSIIMALKK